MTGSECLTYEEGPDWQGTNNLGNIIPWVASYYDCMAECNVSKKNALPTNIGTTRATPVAMPLVVISGFVALGCSKGSLSHYFNICSAIRRTHH